MGQPWFLELGCGRETGFIAGMAFSFPVLGGGAVSGSALAVEKPGFVGCSFFNSEKSHFSKKMFHGQSPSAWKQPSYFVEDFLKKIGFSTADFLGETTSLCLKY